MAPLWFFCSQRPTTDFNDEITLIVDHILCCAFFLSDEGDVNMN